MIKLMAIGNLGKDCLVNNVNGKSVINFSIAHTERFRDASGNTKDKTIWIECAWWTDRTGIAPYLKRGTQVYVEGNPDIKTFQTNDGRSGANLSLRVISVQLLGSKPQESNQYPNYTPPANQQQTFTNPNDLTEPIDDLPF